MRQPKTGGIATTTHLPSLIVALVLTALPWTCGLAAPLSKAEFQQRVASTYDFTPHKLSQSDLNTKSDQLDAFWSLVTANPDATLALLRLALQDPNQSAFFYYDGSKLLLSISKQREDQELALRSIPKADFQDIQPTDYLQTIHWFASNGFDTREAAFRILAFPEFQAFIAQHALTLGQDYSLIYMLFPMQESVFVGNLATRLTSEANTRSQKSLLLALWYAADAKARAALKQFASAQTGAPEARAYARQLLARKPASQARASAASAESLRQERRKIMSRPISDEALGEFDQLTDKLLARLLTKPE